MKSKILLGTLGTRGDVQPVVALAQELRRRRYDVSIACDELGRGLVERHSLSWQRLGSLTQEGFSAIESEVGCVPNIREQMNVYYQRIFKERLPELTANLINLGEQADIFVFNPAVASIWREIVSSGYNHRTPAVIIHYAEFSENLVARFAVDGFNNLLAIDPSVKFLLPSTLQDSTWRVTGFLFMEDAAEWKPGEELERFIEAGAPPVVITMGSMCGFDPVEFTKMALDAIEQAGQRAIIQGAWAGLGAGRLPERVLRIGEASYDWLFPRASCIVHHGGAGTTAYALKAGKPSVFIPQLFDQVEWAEAVQNLGASPGALMPKDVSTEDLYRLIGIAVSSHSILASANRFKSQIKARNGILNAYNCIEDFL